MTRATWARVAAVAALLLGVAVALRIGREPARPEVAPAVASTPPEPADPPAPPAPAAAAPPPAAVAPPPAPAATALLDEAALMARLRRLQDADPEQCVELAREGNSRFPDSPDAPERASRLIHALAAVGRVSEARAEAESMVNDYDDSPWVREVERFTGAHRHRNVRLAQDGAVEFY